MKRSLNKLAIRFIIAKLLKSFNADTKALNNICIERDEKKSHTKKFLPFNWGKMVKDNLSIRKSIINDAPNIKRVYPKLTVIRDAAFLLLPAPI